MTNKKEELEASLSSFPRNPLSIIKISLEEGEARDIIRCAYSRLLEQYNYNISRILRDVEMSRQTFYNKLEQYGLDIKKMRREYNNY